MLLIYTVWYIICSTVHPINGNIEKDSEDVELETNAKFKKSNIFSEY